MILGSPPRAKMSRFPLRAGGTEGGYSQNSQNAPAGVPSSMKMFCVLVSLCLGGNFQSSFGVHIMAVA